MRFLKFYATYVFMIASEIKKIGMNRIKVFIFPVTIIGLLIISSIAFSGCRPDDVEIENNGKMCDTCVIVYNHAILPENVSPTGNIKNPDF